ncbi:activating transcription factor 7-interacting protein 1 [Rhinophrynus dorsalis]
MDTSEEPQKKIFKARKTMKASDRQQLEVVHKAKEELFKPNELKLLNGNHENGDSDISATYHDTEYMEDKTEVNGMIDLNSDSHDIPIVKLSDLKEGLKNLDQTKDLKLKLEIQPTVSHSCQENKTSVLVSEGRVEVSTENTEVRCEQNTIFEKKEQTEADGFPLVTKELPEELSEEKVSVEEESHIVLEGIHELEEENPEEGENSKENENLKEDLNETVCEQESIDVLTERQENEGENELELEDKKGHSVEGVEHLEDIDGKEILDGLQKENEEREELLQDAKESEELAEVIVLKQDTSDLTNGPEETEMTSKTVADEEGCAEKGETIDVQLEDQDAGEEAISSSMETDQNINEERKSSAIPESNLEKSHSDFPIGCDLESVDTMETDEIIPILEKLAPVEDELQCFSKTALHLEGTVNPDEDKAGNDVASPSKQDNSGTLPSEAFLVLSDEEEPCDEVSLSGQEKTSSPKDASKDFPEEPVENEEEQEMEEHVTELEAERNDVSRRKRSKSEDLDSESSKRPRYEGEEYEAELQVKITAGDDLNKKLQKVIQKMLEEKLNVLQCAVFDKTLTDLRTRVEKIECKKHENILYGIQAKITRLTKRYGAAKEDLKKRPEQTPATQPASPGKPANEASSSNNTVTYRNASTVRQMLESKRNVGDATTVALQTPATGQQSLPTSSSLPLRTPNTTQMTVSQSSANTSLQGRAPPDWKLIQQRINASSIGTPQNNQSKPSQPVASAQVMTSVIPASSTPAVVGNSQVSASNTQPMSVSLQSLPVILHVPVAMQSQSQLMQGTTGTLVTNQQSGNVEFIPVQNQSTVSNLTKTPQVSLAATKPINSPSMPSSGIQRNSPANSVASTLTVQTIPTTHSVVQSSRPSLPPAGSSGMYSQANNRNSSQIKAPGSGFNSSSSEAPMASRTELQGNRPTTAETTLSKRTAESTTTSGKAGGVIDLTLDEEDPEMTSQDSRRASTSNLSGNTQSSQIMGRPSQPPQPNTLQSSSAPTGIASQATIHVLPTAQTTVNVTQRPGAQISTRATAPRAPNNQQMAYTTTNLPTVPAQTPLRNTAMQNQNLRQITPQTGGVPVRMPQTTAYVVNNGMPIGSTGPQLTVHHRPPQEPVRPIHPAPLPEAPQPPRLPPEAASTSAPQKPHLKLARVQSQNGIVLSWSVLEVDRSCAIVDSYHLYAYHEDPTATSPSQWKKIGEVKALPLPMACTLTQFVSGSKYYFAVRAKDIYGRFGPFCDPQSTDVISTQNS